MTTLQKFQEVANIQFVDYDGDIEIGTMLTADGYEVYYVTDNVQNLHWENDVFYYQPDFDTIMQYINDSNTHHSIEMRVWCEDIEDYFDEFMMLDYLESNMDEEAFEEFTNNLVVPKWRL